MRAAQKTRRIATRLAALALLLCLTSAPTAQATYDPLGSGTTKLALDKRFLAFLTERLSTFLVELANSPLDEKFPFE